MQITLKAPRRRRPADRKADSPAPRLRDVVLVGAHGGAGVSTLQALLGAATDLGAVCAADGATPLVPADGRPLVVVCRGTVPGSARAVEVVNALLREGWQVAALVVVADGAGPLPGDARARFTLLADRVGGIVHVPFHPAFRLRDDPASVRLPERVRAAVAAIRELTDPTAASGDSEAAA